MKEKKLYTIGDMAKLCGISARQLRYYDQLGIIRPSYRNPDNGYRLYTDDQIEMLFFLKELKKIGISNDSVQRLFVNRDVDQLVQELQINLAMVEKEIQTALSKYRNIVDALVLNSKALAYLHGQEAIQSEYGEFWISLMRVPEKKILYIRYNEDLLPGDRNEYIKRVVDLTRLADAKQMRLGDTKIYIRNPGSDKENNETDSRGYYEIAREIIDEDIPVDSANIRSFGGFNAICTVNVGKLTTLGDAYATIQKWAEDHNLAVSNVAIEEYMVDTFSSVDENRYVTRIMIPLAEY